MDGGSGHQTQQVVFGGGDGRVGGQHEECGVHGAQGSQGLCGVLAADRSGAGGVDQFDAVGQQWCAQSQDHVRRTEPVVRVGGLRDVVGQRVRGVLLHAAVGEPDGEAFGVAFPHSGGERGDRYGSGGQDVASEERVEEGALAAFGLAGNQDAEAVLVQLVAQRGEQVAVVRLVGSGRRELVEGPAQPLVGCG